MNALRGLFLSVALIGIAVNNYGYLHDILWAKHDGVIFMGTRSYVVVFVGIVMALGGILMIWRSAKKS